MHCLARSLAPFHSHPFRLLTIAVHAITTYTYPSKAKKMLQVTAAAAAAAAPATRVYCVCVRSSGVLCCFEWNACIFAKSSPSPLSSPQPQPLSPLSAKETYTDSFGESVFIYYFFIGYCVWRTHFDLTLGHTPWDCLLSLAPSFSVALTLCAAAVGANTHECESHECARYHIQRQSIQPANQASQLDSQPVYIASAREKKQPKSIHYTTKSFVCLLACVRLTRTIAQSRSRRPIEKSNKNGFTSQRVKQSVQKYLRATLLDTAGTACGVRLLLAVVFSFLFLLEHTQTFFVLSFHFSFLGGKINFSTIFIVLYSVHFANFERWTDNFGQQCYVACDVILNLFSLSL